MVKKIVSLVLAVFVVVGLALVAVGSLNNGDDLYIVDKGMALSYVDEYGFTHDTAYWLIVGDNEQVLTVFTTGKTWHSYAVGEMYLGPMERFIVYEGDDGIARYLGDENYVHP